MDTIITRESKMIVDSLGRLKIKTRIPDIELEIEGNRFPPQSSIQNFIFTTKNGNNKIYIDYGDDSPIYQGLMTPNYNPNGGGGLPTSLEDSVHNYTDSIQRKVKIWFDRPENIVRLSILYTKATSKIIGNFPLTLGLYDFNVLELRGTNFDDFPIQLSGGTYKDLTLNNITRNSLFFIPKWIYNSKIITLSLLGGFDLSDLAISNLDKLILIQGLNTIVLNDIKCTSANIPNNLKDISTLRMLSFGNIYITEIPSQFNSCKQLTKLAMGYFKLNTSSRNDSLTSWGIGIVNMPNLKSFSANACTNVPTDLVTGIETSGINLYETKGAYKTETRINESFTKALTKVETIASKVVGNTLLRNITWQNGLANPVLSNTSPTGIYQAPLGFILGSSNGTPTSARECIYVLVNQYRWIITINETISTTAIYAP